METKPSHQPIQMHCIIYSRESLNLSIHLSHVYTGDQAIALQSCPLSTVSEQFDGWMGGRHRLGILIKSNPLSSRIQSIDLKYV